MSNEIRGEYWIQKGNVDFADGDIGDSNHESIATDHVFRQYVDNIFSLAEEFKVDTSNLDVHEPHAEAFSEALTSIYEIVEKKESDPDKFIMNELGCGKDAYAILTGGGDPVGYCIKYEKWIAVRSMNVDLYDYVAQRRNLAHGLDEILEQERVETDSPDEIDFWIEDYKTKKTFSATLQDIEGPAVVPRPTNTITSQGHRKFTYTTPDTQESKPTTNANGEPVKVVSTPNKTNLMAQRLKIIPKGTQLWRPTSENFSFKEWLMEKYL